MSTPDVGVGEEAGAAPRAPRPPVSVPGPWHLRAVVLPDGDESTDLWLDASGLTDRPLRHALELPGAYVLPGGLVDAHFHATLDFASRGLDRHALIDANLLALERGGVLAARDVGQAPDAPRLTRLQGARFSAARTLLAPPDRYFPGLGEDAPQDRVVELAIAQAQAGAEWVKVVLDFVGFDGNWFAAPRNYDQDTLERLVRAVHSLGTRVAVHTTGPAVADAVRAGVDSIEHGPSMDPATVEEMARRGTIWVPTLWTTESHLTSLSGTPVVTAWRGQLRVTLALALRRGVAVLAGSDEMPAGRLYRELAQMASSGGLSNTEALTAATTAARDALDLPGHPADLVTYDVDPREDIDALARPAAVVVGGERIA